MPSKVALRHSALRLAEQTELALGVVLNQHDCHRIGAGKDMLVAVIALTYLTAPTCSAWFAADSAVRVALMPIEHGSRLADNASIFNAKPRHSLPAIAESFDRARSYFRSQASGK